MVPALEVPESPDIRPGAEQRQSRGRAASANDLQPGAVLDGWKHLSDPDMNDASTEPFSTAPSIREPSPTLRYLGREAH